MASVFLRPCLAWLVSDCSGATLLAVWLSDFVAEPHSPMAGGAIGWGGKAG